MELSALWVLSMVEPKQLKTQFAVGDYPIGSTASPYFIAEAGSNFDQNLDTARRLIDIARIAGANAVKFQLFRADVLFPQGGEAHDAFKAVELNPDWVPILATHASDQGITFLASAFDKQSVSVLESVNVCAHKIASSETTNMELVDTIAATGKPVFLSTGMCDLIDVHEAVSRFIARDNFEVALLQCGAMYPLPPEHAHLRVMDLFKSVFDCPIGFSDHSLGLPLAFAAVARGANVIEKHFTHDRSSKGPDHFYALEPEELKSLISGSKSIFEGLGVACKEMLPSEKEFGRREGLYTAEDIKEGTELTTKNVTVRRPALGLRERYFSKVLGMVTKLSIKAGTPIYWQDLEPNDRQ